MDSMACALQAASTVKRVDVTLLACDNKETQRKSQSLLKAAVNTV